MRGENSSWQGGGGIQPITLLSDMQNLIWVGIREEAPGRLTGGVKGATQKITWKGKSLIGLRLATFTQVEVNTDSNKRHWQWGVSYIENKKQKGGYREGTKRGEKNKCQFRKELTVYGIGRKSTNGEEENPSDYSGEAIFFSEGKKRKQTSYPSFNSGGKMLLCPNSSYRFAVSGAWGEDPSKCEKMKGKISAQRWPRRLTGKALGALGPTLPMVKAGPRRPQEKK